jgi:hypothetical protein
MTKKEHSKNQNDQLNKVDRGLQFMLHSKLKEEHIFSLIWGKMVTFFDKEYHLRFEFYIKPKRRLTNDRSHNINA